jgi:hypothetical protein
MAIFDMFKKKERQPQEAAIMSKVHGNGESHDLAHSNSTTEEGTAVEDSKAKDLKHVPTDIVYPSGLKLALLMTSIFVTMFLVSLVSCSPASSFPILRPQALGKIEASNQHQSQDRLIISTAIPQITNEFNSAGDIGWYGAAYLITSCAFQLVFGKLYTVFSVKVTFLTSILLFEAGSALCGAAPKSIAFILGRAIAGLGSGGVMSGIVSAASIVVCEHEISPIPFFA